MIYLTYSPSVKEGEFAHFRANSNRSSTITKAKTELVVDIR